MSKADYKIEGTVPRELLVSEVRKAARQFAMQFFHFSKVLYDQFGLEKTKDIVRQTYSSWRWTGRISCGRKHWRRD